MATGTATFSFPSTEGTVSVTLTAGGFGLHVKEGEVYTIFVSSPQGDSFDVVFAQDPNGAGNPPDFQQFLGFAALIISLHGELNDFT